jgi:type IV pilus assembly protein PilV
MLRNANEMKNRLQLLPSGHCQGQSKQTGIALLETLLAILVFSLGILTVVAIQAASVKMAADAQLRTRAALLANQLVGTMWTSGLELDELQTKFKTGGSEYNKWLADYVKCALPGLGECKSSDLPAEGLRPEVEVTYEAPVDPCKPPETNGEVSITLFWRTPSMKSDEDPRRHVVKSQISRNMSCK